MDCNIFAFMHVYYNIVRSALFCHADKNRHICCHQYVDNISSFRRYLLCNIVPRLSISLWTARVKLEVTVKMIVVFVVVQHIVHCSVNNDQYVQLVTLTKDKRSVCHLSV